MEEALEKLDRINRRVSFLSENREGNAGNLSIKDKGFALYQLANLFAATAKAQAVYIQQLEARCANKWMVSKTFNDCRKAIIEASRVTG